MSAAHQIDAGSSAPPFAAPSALSIAEAAQPGGAANDNLAEDGPANGIRVGADHAIDPAVNDSAIDRAGAPLMSLAAGPGIPACTGARPIAWPRVFP